MIKLGFCIGIEKLFLFRIAYKESYGRYGFFSEVKGVFEVISDIFSIDTVYYFETCDIYPGGLLFNAFCPLLFEPIPFLLDGGFCPLLFEPIPFLLDEGPRFEPFKFELTLLLI